MRRKSIIDIHIKVVLVAVVYLIIASVFGFNNQFLHEAFGQANTDDLDPGAGVGGDGHNTAPSKDGSKDTSDTKTSAPIPSTSSDLPSPPPPEDLATQEGGGGGNGDSNDQATFRHNAQDIAMELSSLTPQEIREYPITDLSDKDIKLVMQFLHPADLKKVLLYIPQQDLITIEHRLTHHDFDEYLNRLSGSDRIQVESRLV